MRAVRLYYIHDNFLYVKEKESMVALAKGSKAPIKDGWQQLLIDLDWGQTPQDLDLAAVFIKEDGSQRLIFFNDKGDKDANPMAVLSEDAGVGGAIADGGNRETMKILNLNGVKEVLILGWNWDRLTEGAPADFKATPFHLTIKDNTGASHDCTMTAGDLANVALIGRITNSPIGAEFVNEDRGTMLKGVPDQSEELAKLLVTAFAA
jgi:tellurite resistance protein TerA